MWPASVRVNVLACGQIIEEPRHNARLGHVLEAGCQLDERGLAEGSAKETDSHGKTEEVPQGHIDDGIAPDRGEIRGAEEEAVPEDQVRGPGGGAGRRYDAIEVEVLKRLVDSVHRGQAIDL